ncbi:hypothetical protein DINM_000868 [Dirofilaria immitis]|nr:hypothetical protein [Dirofilaria immitis]
MNPDESNDECLVEQLRKELHRLIREEEETKQILKKTDTKMKLEEVKTKEKTDQKFLIDRLKAVQNKLLTASWVISRRKEKEELANLRKQIDEVRAKKERLLQSIQEKNAIFAESHELPFKSFCVATATAALKNHALLKNWRKNISLLHSSHKNYQIKEFWIHRYYHNIVSHRPVKFNRLKLELQKKVEQSSGCPNNVEDVDENEEIESFDCMREKILTK